MKALLNAYTLKPMPQYPADTFEWRCDYCGSTKVFAQAHVDMATGEVEPDGSDEIYCGGKGRCQGDVTTATVTLITDPWIDPDSDHTPEFP